jgi:predicted nucleic acid-binding protein
LSVYADSSFVVSLYVNDSHSAEARVRVREVPWIAFTSLHRAEWAHALAKQQFWGNLTAETAERIQAQFVSDQAAGLWRETPLPELAFELCADLGRRYGAKIGMRTLDTLHVACALELKA